MFDTVITAHTNLSHDMPCHRCGHAAHTFLACSDECACVPSDGTAGVHTSAPARRAVRVHHR